MTSPVPGSDPNAPQGGQPGWSAPQDPAQGYGTPNTGAPAPTYSGAPAGAGGAPAKRPGQVTAAAVIGVVIGGLGTLGGLLTLFAIGAVFAIDAVLGILALLSFAAAVVLLIGGIQVLRGQSPKLLLMGSYASIALQLLYLVWALMSDQGLAFTSLLGCILPVLIVVLLRQPPAKQWFGARGMTY